MRFSLEAALSVAPRPSACLSVPFFSKRDGQTDSE